MNEAFVNYISAILLRVKDPDVIGEIEMDVLSLSGSSLEDVVLTPGRKHDFTDRALPRTKTEVTADTYLCKVDGIVPYRN